MAGKLLTELHYLPNIDYFIHILNCEEVVVEACEYYEKQTLRNRCHILTANKINCLTVPVMKPHQKVFIRDIRVDYSQRWVSIHWKGINSAYAKAPYFEFYSDMFRSVLGKNHKYLFDLNLELLTVCLKILGIEKKITFTAEFSKYVQGNEVKDLRNYQDPKGNSPNFSGYSYQQVFGKVFVPNLSIIDLIFAEGNNSSRILKMSKKN